MKGAASSFVKSIEGIVREHSLPKSTEIVEAAKLAANTISNIVDEALRNEPDFVHADDLLLRLASLFAGKTGQPYESARLEELHKRSAERYSKRIPPGYKDESKPEMAKFGDAIVWFQLLDFAKATKKTIIFITRDVKEDWWLQYNGETIGPRPELTQEMTDATAVRFYMYTTARFLEFAQQFFNLKPEPTKKATSEIAEIENQDKHAAAQTAYAWTGEVPTANYPTWFVQPITYNQGDFFQSSPFIDLPLSGPESAVEEIAKNAYLQLLPINGQVFNSTTGEWKCEITTATSSGDCYKLRFDPMDAIRKTKHLTLWVSSDALRRDADWRYKKAIVRLISDWLGREQATGEIKFA